MRLSMLTLTCLVMMSNQVFAAENKAEFSPEVVLMEGVKALRANNLLQFFNALPQTLQMEMETKWNNRRGDKLIVAEQGEKLDILIARLRAPGAVDELMKDIEPQLLKIKPAQISFVLNLIGGGAPALLAEIPSPHPALVDLSEMVQGLGMDASQWVGKAGLNESDKCRKALNILVTSAQKIEIKDSQAIAQMTIPEYLRKISPLVKSMKSALEIYGFNPDAFLDSIKVTAKNDGDKRNIKIVFTSFGKERFISVPIQKNNETGWILDPAISKTLSPLIMGAFMNESSEPLSPDGNVDPL